MAEEYKLFIHDYEVSNKGNIRRKINEEEYKIINGSIMKIGYKSIHIKSKPFYIHSLVAQLFIGERPEGLVVDHIDRNKLNNDVSNLRYVTRAQNSFNRNEVKAHIPQGTPNREKLVVDEWRKANRERMLAKMREYGKSHPDRHKKTKVI